MLQLSVWAQQCCSALSGVSSASALCLGSAVLQFSGYADLQLSVWGSAVLQLSEVSSAAPLYLGSAVLQPSVWGLKCCSSLSGVYNAAAV